MIHIIDILSIKLITHNVLKIVTEKPPGYFFKPGQATDISINNYIWHDEKRPFTFTSLPQNKTLEFTIKTYPSRVGVTNELLKLKRGDELLIYKPFGSINYRGEGIFIAGGAGVTPFISIFRQLNSSKAIGKNKLIFANKTKDDIINKKEFERLLGSNFINVLSQGNTGEYEQGYITRELLEKYHVKHADNIYLCGPPPMMYAVEGFLCDMGVNKKSIVKEKF